MTQFHQKATTCVNMFKKSVRRRNLQRSIFPYRITIRSENQKTNQNPLIQALLNCKATSTRSTEEQPKLTWA